MGRLGFGRSVFDIFISLMLVLAVSQAAAQRKPQASPSPTATPTKTKTSSRKTKMVVECKELRWKGQANAPLKDIKNELDRMPRKNIIQLAWGEARHASDKASMALPILSYLAGTEQVRAIRGYFKLMIYALTDGRNSEEMLDRWPARTDLRPVPLSLREQCTIYSELTK